MRLQKRTLPILWLATLVLFPFEPAGHDIAGVCWVCITSLDDPAPASSHASCAQLQNLPNALRRVDNDIVEVVSCKPLPIHSDAAIGLRLTEPRLGEEAFLLSRRWQFALRAAAPPRAPSLQPARL